MRRSVTSGAPPAIRYCERSSFLVSPLGPSISNLPLTFVKRPLISMTWKILLRISSIAPILIRSLLPSFAMWTNCWSSAFWSHFIPSRALFTESGEMNDRRVLSLTSRFPASPFTLAGSDCSHALFV